MPLFEEGPDISFSSADLILNTQQSLLQKQLRYVFAHSPYYQRKWNESGINSKDLHAQLDLGHLPVTTKDDLQLHNSDFVCVNPEQIVEYSTSSGTLGKPVTFVLSENDLQRLAYNEYLSFSHIGATASDVFQLAVTMDKRFMAGLAYYLGARRLGAGIVRVGPGNMLLQWETIARISPSILVGVPSFLVRLAQFAQSQGISVHQSSIKKILCIGEPIRKPDLSLNTLGSQLQESWPVPFFSTYASTEMSTAFTECTHGKGGHVIPQLVIVECLDDQNKPVIEGAIGEVTVTMLGVEAMPLVRFKTGDLAKLHSEPCKCGRHTSRLGPIVGRKQQMIKLKGTTVYPPAIFELLQQVKEVSNYVLIVRHNAIGTEELIIELHSPAPEMEVRQQLKSLFQSRLRVLPQLVFRSAEEIQRRKWPEMARKPRKLIDER